MLFRSTEEKILAQLKNETENRTSVFISHRISGIKRSSHILMLDQGCIIEEGTHLSLLKKKGAYYDLYRRQLTEAENS